MVKYYDIDEEWSTPCEACEKVIKADDSCVGVEDYPSDSDPTVFCNMNCLVKYVVQTYPDQVRNLLGS